MDRPAVVASSKAGSRVATGQPGPRLSPSKKQKTLADASGALGLPLSTAPASTAAPAAAATTVGPSKYKDVRGTQAEQDAIAELQERARALATEQSGPTKSVRLLSNVQSARATTGQPGWPADAPWWNANYVHPDKCVILHPDEGRTFHRNVPSGQRIDVKKGRTDYMGPALLPQLHGRLFICSA